MTILFNGWLPDAGASIAAARAKFTGHAYCYHPDNANTQAPTEQAGALEVVPDPLGGGFYCVKTALTTAQVVADTCKAMLFPITPTAADPITDWAGQSAVRRWYRFALLTMDWPREPRVLGMAHSPSSQLVVSWQLHDQADSNDQQWEPPLWLIDDGYGSWSLRSTYDARAQTDSTAPTRRELTHFPIAAKWNEVVIYMKPSWTNGFLHVWLNRRKVFSETGVPNCYNNDAARGGSYNFIEYGIYGGKAQQVLGHTIYHKGMQIGDQAYTTFDQFMAACGSSDTELEAFVTDGESVY